MPNRPRSHQLETESRQALEAFLGLRFVYRRTDGGEDYGLDGTVDAFDENGRATGISFHVQLKGTDEPDFAKALFVDLKVDTADYYRSVALPVLMVRYLARDGSLYGRWVHRGELAGLQTNTKTVRFRWQPGDALTRTTPEDLALEAQAYVTLRSPSLSLPISVFLDTTAGVPFALTRAMMLSGMRIAAEACPETIRIVAQEPGVGDLRVIATSATLTVDLAGVVASSVELENYDPGECGERFGIDSMLLLAVAFEQIGRTDVAVRLTTEFLASSSFNAAPEVAWGLAAVLRRTRRISDALGLAEALDTSEDGDSRDASLPFMLVARWHARKLDANELRLFEEVTHQRIGRRESSEAACESYNLAGVHRARTEPDKALAAYALAVKLDPSYADRGYFRYERAGMLFHAGLFQEAAEAYASAYDLEGNPDAYALRADALMLAGRYAQSREAFAEYEEMLRSEGAEGRAQDFWRLKQQLLSYITESFDIKQQTRDAEASTLAGSIAYDTTPVVLIEEQLIAALNKDALDQTVWFNLGKARFDQDDRVGACWAYLGAALRNPGDAEAWANVVILAAATSQFDLMLAAMTCGIRMARERFRQQITRLSEAQDREFPHDQFLEAVDEAFEANQMSEPEDGLLLRLHQADGSLKEAVLSST
jgi:tetratricopeptide (TPR) repeat protein